MLSLKSLEVAYPRKTLYANARKMVEIYQPTDSPERLSEIFSSLFMDYSSLFCKNSELHSLVNQMMIHYYHNEAFIKSTFIQKVLWRGKHVNIFEFPVKDSRIDLCKINGNSVAYEIKTDFDTLKRLSKQLSDYGCVFEFVYVICSARREKDIRKMLPTGVGLYVYRDNGDTVSYRKVKNATRSSSLCPKDQLDCLTLEELRRLVKKEEKDLSKKALCENLLANKSLEDINNIFKTTIKEHYYKNWDFLKENSPKINEIDYQWFFKTMVSPTAKFQTTI